MADVFTSELAFEDALVSVLEKDYGWKNGTFNHPTEQDLLDNVQAFHSLQCSLADL